MSLSRRALFQSLLRPIGLAGATVAGKIKAAEAQVAVIQGRFCLAYQRSFCTTCVERCPIQSAIRLVDGAPQIDRQVCNGCGICAEVCPAPRKAILLMKVKKQ